MRRIGKAAGIEAEAVVVHVNADEVAPQLHLDAHEAIGIFSRPVPNRVPELFGEGGAEIEADAAGRQGTRGGGGWGQPDRGRHPPPSEPEQPAPPAAGATTTDNTKTTRAPP